MVNSTETSQSTKQLLHAAMVVDGEGRRFAPGALLIHNNKVIAAGTPQHIGRLDDVCNRNYEKFVLMPGLVNAHAHLDLTHVGPRHFTTEGHGEPRREETQKSRKAEIKKPDRAGMKSEDKSNTPWPSVALRGESSSGEFVEWVNMIRAARAVDDESIRSSVLRGAELARTGGTALVGDIAGIGSIAAVQALRESGLQGVSYVEVFGIGKRQLRGIETIAQVAEKTATYDRGVRLGIQPHAPYSTGPEVYRAAANSGLPVSTHLAELIEEIEFSMTGGGPMRDLSQQLGVWDETVIAPGKHPIDALVEVLNETPFVAAHLNYVDDAHLELMANWPINIAFCPRASAYFGHENHRYREMLEAGINVCLGTDSIVCLDTPDRISVLDDMRYLYQRDGTDPQLLLRMATINGANALGIDPDLVTFSEGEIKGILAVEIADPRDNLLRQVMTSDRAPQCIVL